MYGCVGGVDGDGRGGEEEKYCRGGDGRDAPDAKDQWHRGFVNATKEYRSGG